MEFRGAATPAPPEPLRSRTPRLFFEEPIFDASSDPYASITATDSGVRVVVPHLSESHRGHATEVLRALLNDVIAGEEVRPAVLWYYTPMSLYFTDHLWRSPHRRNGRAFARL